MAFIKILPEFFVILWRSLKLCFNKYFGSWAFLVDELTIEFSVLKSNKSTELS